MIPVALKGQQQVDLEDPVFVRLINCDSTGDFEKFFQRYGALADDVKSPVEVRQFAASLRKTAEFALSDSRPAGGGDHEKASNRLLSGVHATPKVSAHDGAVRVVLDAPDLKSFAVFELAAAVGAQAKARRCDHCRRLFLYGPMTGRRSHAKYCADRCRVAAMRARNAE